MKKYRDPLIAAATVLVYLVGRFLLIGVWPDNSVVQIVSSFLVLLPILYAAYTYYEIGGLVASIVIVAANIGMRATFGEASRLDPEVLWSSWAAAAGIGILGGYIIRLNKRLKTRTRELEATVREANHRIKNSLSMAAGIVGVERSEIEDPATRNLLSAIEARIGAVADLHGLLAWDASSSTVDLGTYLEAVARGISESAPVWVTVDTGNIETLETPSEQAVSIGVICTELLMNIARHDQTDDGTPNALLRVRRSARGWAIEIASDRGEISEQSLSSSTGMGMTLVEVLVEQLAADLTLVSSAPPAYKLELEVRSS